MSDTVPDLRPQLFAAQRWYAELVRGVDPTRLSEPTPCPDFDVRALLAHMSSVLHKVVALAEDHADPYRGLHSDPTAMAAAAEELARQEVDGRSPQEMVQRVHERIAQAETAWTDAVLDEDIQLGWGPVLPGRIVAGIYLMEILSHGWDLATATGQPSEAPTQVATIGAQMARAMLPEQPRGIADGVPFGPVVASAPDAGPTEQLVNWTGRPSR